MQNSQLFQLIFILKALARKMQFTLRSISNMATMWKQRDYDPFAVNSTEKFMRRYFSGMSRSIMRERAILCYTFVRRVGKCEMAQTRSAEKGGLEAFREMIYLDTRLPPGCAPFPSSRVHSNLCQNWLL